MICQGIALSLQIMKKEAHRRSWFKLDNAAKIYPVISNQRRTSVFRLSATLKQPVHIGALQTAVNRLTPKFPVFQVALRRGFFWYYFERVTTLPEVELDTKPYCRFFQSSHRKDPLLFRVRATAHVIAVEFFHSLTDGGGASEFLKALLWEYHTVLGANLPVEDLYCTKRPLPDNACQDAYKTVFKHGLPYPKKREKAFHIPFKRTTDDTRLLKAVVSAKNLKQTAKQYNVSVTVYLTAVYLFALQKIFQETAKPNAPIIRVQIPINLRNIFNIFTIRNFALFVQPEIDMRLGHYTFEELIKMVFHYMQLETEPKQIHRIVTRNVHPERLWILRLAPRFLKDIVLYTKFFKEGANIQSGVLTNLGVVHLPEALAEKVTQFSFIAPPPNHKFKVNLAVISFADNTVLHFGNLTYNTQVEQAFIKQLQMDNLQVKLQHP